jgi:hypothetical protein
VASTQTAHSSFRECQICLELQFALKCKQSSKVQSVSDLCRDQQRLEKPAEPAVSNCLTHIVPRLCSTAHCVETNS